MKTSFWMTLVDKSSCFNPVRYGYLLLTGLLLVFLISCDTAPPKKIEPKSLSGRTMGTSYHIKLAAEIPIETLQSLHTQIDEMLYRISYLLSTYIPDSEISRFNDSKSIADFPVSKEMLAVVKESLVVSELTGGALDITVGALVNLWGFGKDKGEDRIPPLGKISELLKSTGYATIQYSDIPPVLKKTNPAVIIDLSAIAKGFAVDEVASLIEKNGIASYMVEIGGETKTSGLKQPGMPWRIAIERPKEEGRDIQKVVTLSGKALATSGDYRNYFEVDSKRYSHTLDPMTGWPITHKLASVSVIHTSAMTADAWATAMMVLGPEKAMEKAVEQNLAVYLIIRDGSGFIEKQSPGFEEFVVKD